MPRLTPSLGEPVAGLMVVASVALVAGTGCRQEGSPATGASSAASSAVEAATGPIASATTPPSASTPTASAKASASASAARRSVRSPVPRPEGARAPGVFEGAKSPLDGLAKANAKAADVAWVCGCEVERHNAETRGSQTLHEAQYCESEFVREGVEVLADCLAAYRGDCRKYFACERGDEDFPPRCASGEVAIFSRCYRGCDSDADCEAGVRCIEAPDGVMACIGR